MCVIVCHCAVGHTLVLSSVSTPWAMSSNRGSRLCFSRVLQKAAVLNGGLRAFGCARGVGAFCCFVSQTALYVWDVGHAVNTRRHPLRRRWHRGKQRGSLLWPVFLAAWLVPLCAPASTTLTLSFSPTATSTRSASPTMSPSMSPSASLAPSPAVAGPQFVKRSLGSVTDPRVVVLKDMNQDTTLDVAYASTATSTVGYLRNDGGAVYSNVVVTTGVSGVSCLAVSDVNGDGTVLLRVLPSAACEPVGFLDSMP